MTEFKLPELGENIHQGDLVRLMIAPGATVAEGQAVMELETDKAVVEVPSSVSGVIKEVRVKEGEKIKVGQVIFTIEENGAGGKKAEAEAKTEASPPQPESQTNPKAKAEKGSDGSKGNSSKASAPQPPPAETAQTKTAQPAPTAPSASAEITEFKLPELGENIHQGDLVRLMISPGVPISEGQPVMELETDKAVVEVPSSLTGTVKDVLVHQGDKIKVGQVIFTVEPRATSQPHTQQSSRPDESHEHERSTFQAAMQSEGKTEEQALPPDQPKSTTVASFSMPLDLERSSGTEHRGPVPAAPHVRRLARELGIDIHNVTGSGPGGRISEDDVKAFTKTLLAARAGAATATHVKQPALPDFTKWGKIERVSMRGVRRKTAEHMWEAWSSIPHVTQNDKADITELEQLRTRFGPKAVEAGGKMTVTAIALKVCASALLFRFDCCPPA